MTDSVLAKMDTAVPCGIYKAERDAICGKPANIIILSPSPAPAPMLGRWVGTPMCPACVADLAKVYGIEVNAPPVTWITLADAVTMAHEQQPEKYGADTNYEVRKLRAFLARNEWEEAGKAKKTASDMWMVSKEDYMAYLEEMRGKYLRTGVDDA